MPEVDWRNSSGYVLLKLEGGTGSEIFHQDQQQRLGSINVAVRVNDITTPYFHDDILQIVKDWGYLWTTWKFLILHMLQISQSSVQTLILPKIHSHQDLDYVSNAISSSGRDFSRSNLQIVPSIESARGIWNLGSIAGWKSSHNPQVGGELSAILVRFLYSLI